MYNKIGLKILIVVAAVSTLLTIPFIKLLIHVLKTSQYKPLPIVLIFLLILLSLDVFSLCGIFKKLHLEKSQAFEMPVKKFFSPDDLTFDEAKRIYFNTDHQSCKSVYDYESYFSAAFESLLKNTPDVQIEFSDEKVKRNKEILNPIDEYKNLTARSSTNRLRHFIAFDTETTGLKCGGNDIIEICAIKFDDFVPTEKFHTYLKPRKPIPDEITKITGITNEMVADAPTFSQIKTSLTKFLNGYYLVAHNAPFDIKFLHVSGLDLEPFENKVYDTLGLSRKHIRGYADEKLDDFKLGTICVNNNIACSDFHSADADALACGILFVDIIKQLKDVENIEQL